MRVQTLNQEELKAHLAKLPGWSVQNGALTKLFQFPNFAASMKFVNAIAEDAEAINHHPDIDIRYDKVTLAMVTHDAGGITDLDVQLAVTAEETAGA